MPISVDDGAGMSFADLRRLSVELELITREQWKVATQNAPTPRVSLDQLERMPAWWNPEFPALTSFQRKQLEYGLKNGFRFVDRQLRINEFLILDRLGDGGTAIVFKAWSFDLKQIVALKQLISNDHQLRERQRREARIMQRLRHPRIGRLIGFDPVDFGGGSLLVMEYIEGVTLKAQIADHGPASVEQTVHWLVQLLEALQHAHQLGIIHRDIAHKNIMVQPSVDGALSNVMLLDFGLGKLTSADEDKTRAGVQLGTYPYMSPEHFKDSTHVVPESDIYSLGCVAYVMLTGSPPFKGALPALCMMHTYRPPPPLEEFRNDIPENVVQAVQRMLAKSPNERGSIPELIDMLQGRRHSAPALAAIPAEPVAAPDKPSRQLGIIDRIPTPPAIPSPADVQGDSSISERLLEHPEVVWWSRVVPVSKLARHARFIDPVPIHADFAFFAVRLAKRSFWILLGIAVIGAGFASLGR